MTHTLLCLAETKIELTSAQTNKNGEQGYAVEATQSCSFSPQIFRNIGLDPKYILSVWSRSILKRGILFFVLELH